jgi:hypothetical protein
MRQRMGYGTEDHASCLSKKLQPEQEKYLNYKKK